MAISRNVDVASQTDSAAGPEQTPCHAWSGKPLVLLFPGGREDHCRVTDIAGRAFKCLRWRSRHIASAESPLRVTPRRLGGLSAPTPPPRLSPPAPPLSSKRTDRCPSSGRIEAACRSDEASPLPAFHRPCAARSDIRVRERFDRRRAAPARTASSCTRVRVR